jgi:hypothetical protein
MEPPTPTRKNRVADILASGSALLPTVVYGGVWLIAALCLFGPGVGHIAGDLLRQFAQIAVAVFIGCWLRIRLGTEPLAVIGAARDRQSVWRAILACLAIAAVATPADLVVSLATLHLTEYFRVAGYDPGSGNAAGQGVLSGLGRLDRLPFVTAFFLWTALSEEAIYRLGLLTSLVYALRLWLLRGRSCAMELPGNIASDSSPTAGSRAGIWRDPAFWEANLIQAYIFGAVHALVRGKRASFLQVLAAPPTWSGVILGFLYWRFGIEAAVLTHVFSNLAVIFIL